MGAPMDVRVGWASAALARGICRASIFEPIAPIYFRGTPKVDEGGKFAAILCLEPGGMFCVPDNELKLAGLPELSTGGPAIARHLMLVLLTMPLMPLMKLMSRSMLMLIAIIVQ